MLVSDFQYNGFLLGILLISIAFMVRGASLQRIDNQILIQNHMHRWELLSAATFAALLTMKHLYLILAPLYFFYLLRRHCFIAKRDHGDIAVMFSWSRLLVLAVVTLVCLSGPFIPFLMQDDPVGQMQLLAHVPHLPKPRRLVIPNQALVLKLGVVDRQKLHRLAPVLLTVQEAHEGDEQPQAEEGPPAAERPLLQAGVAEGELEDLHLVGVQNLPARAEEPLDVAQDVLGVVFGEGDAAVARTFGGEGEFDAVVGGKRGYFLDVGDGGILGIVVDGSG